MAKNTVGNVLIKGKTDTALPIIDMQVYQVG